MTSFENREYTLTVGKYGGMGQEPINGVIVSSIVFHTRFSFVAVFNEVSDFVNAFLYK